MLDSRNWLVHASPWRTRATNGKEEPLKCNAVLIRISDGVEPEFEVLVVVLGKVQKDCGRFKDCEIVTGAVNEDWDTSVGV